MKEEIVRLRMSGLSIKQIAKMLGCSTATASKYSRGLRPNNPNRCGPEATANASAKNKEKWDLRKEEIRTQAEKEWGRKRADADFMAFLGLYWGEGGKTSHHLALANGDPALFKFCFDYFGSMTNKSVVVTVRYYPDHDPNELSIFWASILGITVRMRPVLDRRIGKRKGKMKYGIAVLQLSDWRLKKRIDTWLECWKKEIGAVV